MKGLSNRGVVFPTPHFVMIISVLALALAAVVSVYLGSHWFDGYTQLVFHTGAAAAGDRYSLPASSPSVVVSPNTNFTLDVPVLLAPDATAGAPPPVDESPEALSSPPSPPPPPPPPPSPPARVGIVDENGTMREDFDVKSFDPDLVDDDVTRNGKVEVEGRARVKIKKFYLCLQSMREYVPCLDNEEEIKKLKSTERGEKFERHCPAEGKGLDCLVPAPEGYKTPIPWPRSRDVVLSLSLSTPLPFID